MRAAFALAAVASLLAAAPPAAAQTPGRYELQPADGGFLRLDRETGATAFCAQVADGYACRSAEEDRAPLAAEVERLKARIAALEAKGAGGALPPAPPLPDDKEARRSTDQDVERAVGMVEKLMRRFKDMAKEMDRAAPPPESERL